MQKMFGAAPRGAHAHHTLPVKFEQRFKQAGLNIHDPKYGAYWEGTAHNQTAAAYNQSFEAFFRANPNANATQIVDFARNLARRHGLDVVY
jgi:hypothetical protein